MKIQSPSQLDKLLANKTINQPTNDSIYTSGWSHTSATLQFRLDAGEAQKLSDAIKTLPKATQRKVVRELFARQGVGGMGNGKGAVALDDDKAASTMNALAAGLGIMGMHFAVNKQRPVVPMG